METLDKIERLVRNNGDKKEFEGLFSDVESANAKLADEDKQFFDGLSDILSPEQRGKYLLFERHFERELREAVRDIMQRRRMHRNDQ